MNQTLTHKDFTVISEHVVSCQQLMNPTIQDKELMGTQAHQFYQDYRPTGLQFDVYSTIENQAIELTIPYRNRLTRIEAKHAVAAHFNQTEDRWNVVNMEVDYEEKVFTLKGSLTGVYAIFVNHFWYSSYTQEAANEYPSWTRIRKTKESNGQRFLNFFGIHIEELKEYFDWISEQKYIGSADIHMLDWVYVYELIEIQNNDTIELTHEIAGVRKTIPILTTIREFFYNQTNQGGIIDYEKRKFYSKEKYEKVMGIVTKGNQQFEFETAAEPFHIWNTLDEFGLLVGVKRQHLEANLPYKDRILDAFRYKANSSDEGLTNGIARELSMIQRVIWKNDSKAFYLKNRSGLFLDIRSLRIDGQKVNENEYEFDSLGNLVILPLYKGVEHEVSFIQGIEKYELHNKQDEVAYGMMYQPDGQATSRLLGWVEYINSVAPVMWDRFRWDEGFWDTIDKKLNGIGYVPNIWDSSIENWKTYTFDPKRWESETIWNMK
jgi:hypothetical protein